MKLVSIFLILIITQILCEKKVTFEKLLSDLRKDIKMKKIAIAGADNPETLMTSRIAKNMEIGDSILIGDEKKIRQIAEEYDVDISDFEIRFTNPNRDI